METLRSPDADMESIDLTVQHCFGEHNEYCSYRDWNFISLAILLMIVRQGDKVPGRRDGIFSMSYLIFSPIVLIERV